MKDGKANGDHRMKNKPFTITLTPEQMQQRIAQEQEAARRTNLLAARIVERTQRECRASIQIIHDEILVSPEDGESLEHAQTILMEELARVQA